MTWTTRPRSDLPSGLCAIRAGNGPPCVLIHGVGLNADSWGAQIDAMSERHAILAPDLPGHGDSPRLDGAVTLDTLTDCIANAVAAFGMPVPVVGHSLGALIAVNLAMRHPSLVSGIAALNTIHRRSPEARDAVRARAAAMSTDAPNDPAPTLARWFGDDLTRPQAIACRSWLTGVDPAGYKAAYTAFAEARDFADADLAAISCPALFLTGSEEPNSTPAMSRILAAAVPNGRAFVVEGAAHMAMMTHPNIVNAQLDGFLKLVAGRLP